MANYRKSFNLRNGVQVDDDNFIVNPNGLVGIGTSIPTEFLDVRGNVKVVGHTTSNTLYAGIATIDNLKVNQGGVVVSGVVTATSFSGSAAGLTGIYAIAADGWIINSGNSSISTSFKVGIGTTNPQFAFQIGNPFGGNGVYIDSVTSNIVSTGNVSANTFVGNLDASYLTGTINNIRLSSNISVGIVTASSGFYGNLIGTASTANSITSSANIQVNSINSGFSTSGISTVHTTLHVPGNIGVGTLIPNAQLHVRKSGISSIQLTSDGSNSSIITFGRSVNLSTNNAQLRFGNTSGTYPSSTQQSLDIINYDTGNLNFYLNPGGSGTGSYNWFKPSLGLIMTLTSTGNLGINSSSPSDKLSVVGDASISGVATVGILSVTTNATINAIKDKDGQLGSPNQVLTSTGSQVDWQSLSSLYISGRIIQILRFATSSIVSHTTSWGPTGLSTSITPSSVNSRIAVLINQPVASFSDQSGGIRIVRDVGVGTEILYNPGTYCFGSSTTSNATTHAQIASLQYIDFPGITTPITYYTEGISSTNNTFKTNCGQVGNAQQSATSQIYIIEFS